MKERFQVTLNPLLVSQAKRDMQKRGFDSFSEYLESLIRAEWERQTPAVFALGETPLSYKSKPKKP